MLNWAHDNCFVNFPFFGRLVRLKSLLWWPPGIMMFRLCLSILFIVTCSLVNCTNSSKSMFWDNWIYLLKNHWDCSIHGPWTWRSHTSKLSNQPSPLDIVEDRTTLNLLKESFNLAQKCRDDNSFKSSVLILEGIFCKLVTISTRSLTSQKLKRLISESVFSESFTVPG